MQRDGSTFRMECYLFFAYIYIYIYIYIYDTARHNRINAQLNKYTNKNRTYKIAQLYPPRQLFIKQKILFFFSYTYVHPYFVDNIHVVGAEVKERVQLYLHSPSMPSRQVKGSILPLHSCCLYCGRGDGRFARSQIEVKNLISMKMAYYVAPKRSTDPPDCWTSQIKAP